MEQERNAKNAFTKRKELLTKAFSLCLKKRITDYHLEYSSVWCRIVDLLNKEDVRRLESCEMWLWRKVLNISWSDKVLNEEVLRRVNCR